MPCGNGIEESLIAGRYDSLTISVESCARSIVGFCGVGDDPRLSVEKSTSSKPPMSISRITTPNIKPHADIYLEGT